MLEDLCKNDRRIAVDDAVRIATTLRAAVIDIAPDMSDAELRSARIGAVTAASSYADRAVGEKRGGSIQVGLCTAAAGTIVALAAKVPDLAAHPYIAAVAAITMSGTSVAGAARVAGAERWTARVAQPLDYVARVLDDEVRRRRGSPEGGYRAELPPGRVDPTAGEAYAPRHPEPSENKR